MSARAKRIQQLKSHMLSKNLSLYEAVRSDTAERNPTVLNTQLNPPDNVVANLTYAAQTIFQPLRDFFKIPIRCNSGWRSPDLNALVGGSTRSQHLVGQALDLTLKREIPAGVRRGIRKRVKDVTGRSVRSDANLDFYLFAQACLELNQLDIDQVIHEYGAWYGQPSWVHLAASKTRNKRQILAARLYAQPKWDRDLKLKAALSYGTDKFKEVP